VSPEPTLEVESDLIRSALVAPRSGAAAGVVEADVAPDFAAGTRRDLPRDLGGLVIGMDEVGRGALAGPVAVGVVALHPAGATVPRGLRDSKLLTERRRELLHPVLSGWGLARAVGLASAEEVDALGIVAALGHAGARALATLRRADIRIEDSVVLLDGSHDWLSPVLGELQDSGPGHAGRVVTRVRADRDCASVAAASVLAKVHRDRIMVTSDIEHPGFGWAANKGYGSPAHFAALRATGPSPLHRRSFLGRL